jgi:hypothetical protein
MRQFFLRQKFRFDLGYQFLALINFTLLLIAASDKLRYYTNIPRTWILILVFVPFCFFLVWVVGYYLDRRIRYSEGYNLESMKRNPVWAEHKAQLDRIEALLKNKES